MISERGDRAGAREIVRVERLDLYWPLRPLLSIDRQTDLYLGIDKKEQQHAQSPIRIPVDRASTRLLLVRIVGERWPELRARDARRRHPNVRLRELRQVPLLARGGRSKEIRANVSNPPSADIGEACYWRPGLAIASAIQHSFCPLARRFRRPSAATPKTGRSSTCGRGVVVHLRARLAPTHRCSAPGRAVRANPNGESDQRLSFDRREAHRWDRRSTCASRIADFQRHAPRAR